MKKYNNSVPSSFKMTPKQASRKSNEKEGFYNIEGNRWKQTPKYRLGVLVRAADIKRILRKRDSASWSYKLYTINQIIDDTNPSYRINYSSERYNEISLRKLNLSIKEIDDVLKKT